MNVRVKICGITSLKDAQVAIEAGADALGFMFYPESPRYLPPEYAAAIAAQLPPFVARVGVFVNPDMNAVHQAVTTVGLDTLQFHGEETPEFCQSFAPQPSITRSGRYPQPEQCTLGVSYRVPPLPVIKAWRIKDEASLAELSAYRDVSAWLLDAYVKGQRGGTGARFNWDLAVAAQRHNVPIILAGGLTPENVAEAVRQVQPFAVDVSSGVEAAPGRKDPEKVRAFLRAAKG